MTTPPPTRRFPVRLRVLLGALTLAVCLTPVRGPSADPIPAAQPDSGSNTAPSQATNPSALTATQTTPPTSATATNTADAMDRDPDRDRDTDRDSRRSSRRSGDRRRNRSGDTATEGTNAPASGTDFAAFKVIADRNIFNPNRGRGSGRGGDREQARKPVRVDLITLVGALSYAKGDFAFFDGSSSEFRKTLKSGDSIAGYTIQEIRPNNVRVLAGDKNLDVPVGSQFRREDEGEWQFIARSDATALTPGASSSSSSSGPSTSSSPTSTASSGGGPADDILQRLMRKREQEK